MRVAGHGLGNCFYTYFHAVALAETSGATVVTPPWFSLKLGPLLRGERSKRFYWRMFRPFEGEIHGTRKLLTLLGSYHNRVVLKVGESIAPTVATGTLNVVVSSNFTFRGLHAHRPVIRDRLLGTVNDPIPANHLWGGGDYIAIHVRLGDFTPVLDPSLLNNAQPNSRIPLVWYVNLTRALRQRYADKPIYLFSDGEEKELRPILDLGAELYRTGSDMTDLLAMAGASILVGSNSTYSRWAAFLGDMPSIWLKTAVHLEKPTAPETPILHVPIDCTEPVLWE